jgi:hypothetical protein
VRASLPADLQELKAQFDSWRQSRTSRRTRVPESLRQAAQALLARYPASYICRACRLHPRILRAKAVAAAKVSGAIADTAPTFYSLPSLPTADCRLLLERSDGARLSLVLPALDAASLSALCSSFLRS